MSPVLSENMARGAGCLYDWAQMLAAGSYRHSLMAEFRRPKFEIYELIRQAGLKAPEFVSLPASKMAQNVEEHVSRLKAQLFYVLTEKKGDFNVKSAAGNLTKKKLVEIIRSIPPSDGLMITVIEETKCLMEGTVIVSDQGTLSAEFSYYQGSPLTRGQRVPAYRIESKTHTNLLQYFFEDKQAKAMIYQALREVPFNVEERAWLPGYYELSIATRPGESIPRIFVLDFRSSWL